MIHFQWPWLALALPLPLLLRSVLPSCQAVQHAALKVPFLADFDLGGPPVPGVRLQHWPLLLAAIAWALLVTAATRPQWLGDPIEQAVSGRDLMLAVDLSGSMEAQDFFINNQPVDRLTAAKSVARDFIARRLGDRIGLILFGSQAYLQVPLTFDRKTVETLLGEAVIGLAGENTAIGDAIGLAVKRLGDQPGQNRVLVLMTDGANTAGEVSPLKAGELAKAKGLKIYTIGLGADEMVVHGLFGNHTVNPSLDLDEDTLIKIAESTGGHYYRARNTAELDGIYLRLDELEPLVKEQQYFRPRTELYPWPLAAALLVVAALVCWVRKPL